VEEIRLRSWRARREERVGQEKSHGNRLIGTAGFARLSMASGFWNSRDTGYGHRDWAFCRCTIETTVVDTKSSLVSSLDLSTMVRMLGEHLECVFLCPSSACCLQTRPLLAVPNHLLSPTLPNPLLILFPLPLNIPEPLPPLTLPANPAIQTQKRIRITLT